MRCQPAINDAKRRRAEAGSVLIIVLWISIGLVSIALYFANSMNYELQAADNRVSGIAADQAIEGAARYVSYVLSLYGTNGVMPVSSQFQCAAVPVGAARFWLIGRDPNQDNPTEVTFGLVDEAAKLNLNSTSTNVFQYLPYMSADFSDNIMDWRGTNGSVALDYTSQGYSDKNAPFETVDELRLVSGATMAQIVGADVNRNGILDANETNLTGSGSQIDYGLAEYVTVYTREPNFGPGGLQLTNVSTSGQTKLSRLLQDAGTSSATRMATAIYNHTHVVRGARVTQVNFNGLFDFCLFCKNQGMSSSDFAALTPFVTTSTNTYIRSRVNFNNASADVLTAVFMGLGQDESTSESAAQTLVSYRSQNSSNLTSVAWVIDALGNNSPVVTALARGDYVTTHTYQFAADIAAVGPYGRGYRRVKFIFDTSDGAPKILYRQDLSHLGWALGDKTRQQLLAKESP